MQQANGGSYILIIRDEPYMTVYPEEKRLINQTIDTNLEKKERWYTVNGKNIPEVNILWYVKGITPETVSDLDTKEQIFLLKDYLFGQKTVTSIKNHQDSYVAQAIKDYETAIDVIFADLPDYKASCGASSRFACSMLKARLKTECNTFEGARTVTELAGMLPADLNEAIKEIIPWIQKSAEDSVSIHPSTMEDAVNGVRSSIALFSMLFPEKTNTRTGPYIRPVFT